MVKELDDRQKAITRELEDHANGDKAFVIGTSYILDVASRGAELFTAESTKLEQKRYLINFVLPNAKLDGEKLIFNLLEPFDVIAEMVKTKNWLGDKKARTLTLDNGQENRGHAGISAATGASVYFRDPYSSWQKGSVEHVNKLLRAYFPKGCDLGQSDQSSVEAACARLNKKPRKILGYKSALQLAAEKGVLTSRACGAIEGECPLALLFKL